METQYFLKKKSFLEQTEQVFSAVLSLQQNWEEGGEISQRPPAPPHTKPPSLSTAHTRVVHLLQSVKLH